ncbi:AbrB family transcriptional regulator [Bacillus canaveralius]|uniref:AbrB family transcriptional regulator n=1 Tax=Bacillus canaveralius TaxID=1403243 RepID=A0A2N5GSN5_9BACI|nr:AbrB family transcriptional regulator [Bacillus canaveralius]PLR92757.1 AbrB family transcriptional regulator [Bacillus canaveralius]RSK54611.1 AbrB/MazE/SpoVT family DNA-binding domain-containing protein [Bacillus canaveralius]
MKLIMTKMAVKPVERKVTRIGNSLGVTFPAEVLEHLNVKQGDEVIFNIEKNGKVSFEKKRLLNMEGFEDIDQDFLEGMQEMFKKYDKTLRNLADR